MNGKGFIYECVTVSGSTWVQINADIAVTAVQRQSPIEKMGEVRNGDKSLEADTAIKDDLFSMEKKRTDCEDARNSKEDMLWNL